MQSLRRSRFRSSSHLDSKTEVPKADVTRGLNAMHTYFYACDTTMEVRPFRIAEMEVALELLRVTSILECLAVLGIAT